MSNLFQLPRLNLSIDTHAEDLACLNDEDLACAGLRRANRFEFFETDLLAALSRLPARPWGIPAAACPTAPAIPPNGSRAQAKPTRDCAIPGHKPGRDISTSTLLTEVPMPTLQSERPPSWTKLELESVKSLRQVEELTSLDRDTLTRVYSEYIVKLSPKRYGMKFRNVLRIINGDAA
jgi:hypothetical protein